MSTGIKFPIKWTLVKIKEFEREIGGMSGGCRREVAGLRGMVIVFYILQFIFNSTPTQKERA